jgi:hypothetical protein
MGLAGALMVTTARAETAEAAVSEADALQALDPWADALFSGDPEAVDRVLAPEFQILRSNGTGYNKEEYLTVLPQQKARSKFSDIVATGSGEILVVRYKIDTDQTIEGVSVIGISPRLSVFRKESESWLMVSHANFAPLT